MNYKNTYLISAIRRYSGKKLFNLIKVWSQKVFFKSDKSWGFPVILLSDPSSACNLHCPLCPNGQGRSERSKGLDNLSNFKKAIDEIGDYLFFVHFGNWGEPLLNKDLGRIIAYANKKNIETIVRSNLTLLDEKNANELISAGLDEIIVGLDGASESSYDKYRRGGNFKKVIANIKLLNKLKLKHRSSLRIVWQFIVSSENENEVDKAKKMASKLGIFFRLMPLRIDMGKEITVNHQKQIENDKAWLPKDERLSFYNYKKKKIKRKIRNCGWLWMKIVINWNGSVSPCCGIWEEKFDFGNAYENGVMKVWNGGNYRKARRIIRNKKKDSKIVCSHCLDNGFLS